MTIEEKLVEILVSNGMFDTQAKEVLRNVKADKVNKPMRQRWNDALEDYPEILVNALWINTKQHALKWIDENAPQAWFRPMFTDEIPKGA